MPDEPVFPQARMNAVAANAPVTGRVVENELCLNGKSSSFVKHTVIDVAGTALAGSFRAGQSFGVLAPGTDDRGRAHKVRLYSIACPTWGEDGQGNVLATTPKRLIDEHKPQRAADDPDDRRLFLGVCSNYLCDLRPGDEVRLSGPNGKRFLLPMNVSAHDYLFFATGTGIAPFRGMLLELLNSEPPVESRIDLVMGAPYTTDLLYDDLFTDLAARHPNFHYHRAISREAGIPRQYVSQLAGDRLEEFAPLFANPRTLLYLCGINGMQTALFRLLRANGFDAPYLRISEPLLSLDPGTWPEREIKRCVKTTSRCLLEVY